VGDSNGPASLSDLVREMARRGTRRGVVEADTGRLVGAAELAESVTDEAARRRSAHRDGDTLALSAPNGAAWLRTMLGAAEAGMIVATVNPLSPTPDVVEQLRRARARHLVCDAAMADRVRGAVPAEVPVEVLAPDPAPPTGAPPATAVGERGPESVIALMTSSGTTGPPKTARMTQQAFAEAARLLAAHWELDDDDVFLGVLPFSHAAGVSAALAALSAGAELVTMPRFDPVAFLDALERHRVTSALLAPPILRLLAHHPAVETRDLTALRVLASAGAPLPPELAEACERRLGVAVCDAYGMTETGWVALDSASGPRRPGTVGAPVDGIAMRLVDPDSGRDVPDGTPGEIWVRGPGASPGYLDDPVATASLITPDGWHRTGDLAVLDDDGRLRIVDRLKDLVKYKGHQVTPAALEALILSRSDVADVAVTGTPDPEAGELPHAYVVAPEGLDPEELMAWVAARVSPHQRIRLVTVVDEIPRLPAGKTLRRLLPSLTEAG
jgi:acyl-CoA synthetase (AMP-forming)/AMP-acid ligase II